MIKDEDTFMEYSTKRNPEPVIRIQPTGGLLDVNFRELWDYRELLYFLIWRDIKVRYKQTAIGIAWVLLQPLAMMLVFTLFFGKLARLPSEGVPYPLFALAGLLPWQLFSRAVTESSNSLVLEQRLISKIFFPRLLIPTAATLAALVDFSVSLSFLLFLSLAFGFTPGLQISLLPFLVLIMIMTALGISYWLSALNVEYRDVMYTIPFINQIWMFLTPIVYPSSLIPDAWQTPYSLNPMVGVVEGFRWCLLGTGDGLSPMLLASATVSVLLFTSGLIWFRRLERTFVDSLG